MTYQFASFSIKNQVFFASKLSLGFVNLKPLVPGHVLVIPRRVVPRVSQLTRDEVSDLFLSVQRIASVIEAKYGPQAMNIACQDGIAAGQSVPHVHVHIVPRIDGDFEPKDNFYEALDKFRYTKEEKERAGTAQKFAPPDEDRKPRTPEVMKQEALELSQLFDENERGIFE